MERKNAWNAKKATPLTPLYPPLHPPFILLKHEEVGDYPPHSRYKSLGALVGRHLSVGGLASRSRLMLFIPHSVSSIPPSGPLQR